MKLEDQEKKTKSSSIHVFLYTSMVEIYNF
jgi:hypothetical protein